MSNVVPIVYEIEDDIELNLVLNTYSTNNRNRTMLSVDISPLWFKSENTEQVRNAPLNEPLSWELTWYLNLKIAIKKIQIHSTI